jgi:two-component system chemotaxis response regulator CheB
LVVDDSAFMRQVLGELIDAMAGITLDIEMPGEDGLATLARIRARSECPVVMVTGASSPAGVDLAVAALALGASEVVLKPSGPISLDAAVIGPALEQALLGATTSVPRAPVPIPVPVRPAARALPSVTAPPGRGPRSTVAEAAAQRVVVVAASTGGPQALTQLIGALPAPLGAAVVIVQHLPPGFSASLAARLDAVSALPVREARDGAALLAEHVYVAPSAGHTRLAVVGAQVVLALADDPPCWGVRPAADPLFASAAAVFGAGATGVVLTGMGRDGAAGLARIAAAGGQTLVEDPATATVPSMPLAAQSSAGTCVALPDLAAAVTRAVALSFPRAASAAP